MEHVPLEASVPPVKPMLLEPAVADSARAFRQFAAQRNLGLVDSARMFAALWTGYTDAFIGCTNAKYIFSFWRPVAAIRLVRQKLPEQRFRAIPRDQGRYRKMFY